MHDPVVTASGFTFERMAIEQWLKSHDTCPLTSAPLLSKVLFPNTVIATEPPWNRRLTAV